MSSAGERIKKYHAEHEIDPDFHVRLSAAQRHYSSFLLTKDDTLKKAAEKIWKELNLHPDKIAEEIDQAKKNVERRDSYDY